MCMDGCVRLSMYVGMCQDVCRCESVCACVSEQTGSDESRGQTLCVNATIKYYYTTVTS